MRAFIAIEIPKEIKNEIVKLQETLSSLKIFHGKLTETENLHLTLKFLGEISDEKAEEVKEKLKEIKFKKFKVKISEVGVFSPHFVRIIWVKINGKEILELQNKIDSELKNLFEPERRFMSHMTLVRVKKVEDKAKLLQFLASLQLSNKEFEVSAFVLKESKLKPEGPIYTDLEIYPLE